MRVFFAPSRGPLGRGNPRGTRSVVILLLETLPPIFHIVLLSALTYYSFYLNPGRATWHLITFFVVAQLLANWWCFYANRSIVLASPKNFPGYVHRYPSLANSKDPGLPTEEERQKLDEYRTLWRECDSCDMHVPLRTHHCGHCRRCIYVLDHHCYFLGACVGRTNMRYFLIFCLYACVGSALGVYNLIDVMLFYRYTRADLPFYVLPFTFAMWLAGRAAAFEVLYVGLINFGMGASGACAYLFFAGLYSVATDKTPHERSVVKKVSASEEKRRLIRQIDEDEATEKEKQAAASLTRRFRDVFGECGWLHLLVPVVPFEMPKVDMGYRRIITYNNDYIMNGTIHTSEENLDYTP